MADGSNGKLRRSAIAVLVLVIAIGIVVWVLLTLMACGTASTPASGEASGAAADTAQAVDVWLPVNGTLYGEDPETGELAAVARVTVERDERGLLTNVTETTYAGGAESTRTQTRYDYDDAGHVLSREVTYTDEAASSSANTITSNYEYDNTGLLTVITTPQSESTGRELFDYDEHGHLITIMQTYDLEASSKTYFMRFEYNADDLPIAATSEKNDPDPATVETWSYDGDGRLAAFSVLPMGEGVANLMDYTLSYDDAGRVSTVACAPGDYVTARYGEVAKAGYDAEVTYTYDEQGKCSEAHATGSYTYGDEFVTSATCGYDEDGNLTRVDFTDTNIFDGQESRQRYALELQYELVSLPEDAAKPASSTFLLTPTCDKQLFSAYLAQPSLPVTPSFGTQFPSAAYLGFEPVLLG